MPVEKSRFPFLEKGAWWLLLPLLWGCPQTVLPDGGGAVDGGAAAAGLPPLSTKVCELPPHSGPIPQPPQTQVADFSAPVRVLFDDPCPQNAVEIAPDGSRIYYSYAVNTLDVLRQENRQRRGVETQFRDRVAGGAWGPPYVLDLQQALPGSLAGEIRVADDASWVLWHALGPDNYGYLDGLPANQSYDLDLYEAALVNGVPGPTTHLGREVNSAYLEGEHWVTPDGQTIYFASNRPGGRGGLDLWKVGRDDRGYWHAAEALPEPVNSAGDELQPVFSPDGAHLYFVSNRDGVSAIYRTDMDGEGGYADAAERVLGPYVGEPSFTSTGRLFFVHVEIDFSVTPAVIYDSDIYFVEPQ